MSRYQRYDDAWVWFVGIIVIIAAGFTMTYMLRQHGISSCRERGGQPVTRSWISEDAWDVSCIEAR